MVDGSGEMKKPLKAGGNSHTESNALAILATLAVLGASLVGVVLFYPKALAQSHYYVSEDVKSMVKLPNVIVPLSYDVHLQPDLTTGVTQGEEKIRLRVDKPVSRIALHVQGMTITGLNLLSGSTMAAGILHTEHDKGLAYFTFQQPIAVGEAVLELSFTYHLRQETMQGFFLRTFNSRMSTHKNIPFASTWVDPSGLREVFPCFDEPHFKANVTVSIVVPEGYTALASSKEADSSPLQIGGRKIQFQPTLVPISPNKVGFVVAPLKSIETTTSKGLLVRVWAEDGLQAQSRLALRLAVDAAEYIGRYTKVALPLNKLDLVAMPDFVDPVRQNWGLCQFHEAHLIYDVSMSPASDRAKIGTAVWKCLADHWFLDYVAPRDAKHQWMHEALSSLVVADVFEQSSALSIVGGSRLSGAGGDDDREMWLDLEEVHQGLLIDSLPSSRALEEAAHNDDGGYGAMARNAEEVSQVRGPDHEIVDDLGIRKGSAVLNMIRVYVDNIKPGSFEAGLQQYLSAALADRNPGGVPSSQHLTPDALMAALEEQVGHESEVVEMAKDWMHRPSYPIVELDVEKDVLVIKQHQYTVHNEGVKGSSRWRFPLQYRSPALPNGSDVVLIHPTATATRIPCTECLAKLLPPVRQHELQTVAHTNQTVNSTDGRGRNGSTWSEDSNRTQALELEMDDMSHQLSALSSDQLPVVEEQPPAVVGGPPQGDAGTLKRNATRKADNQTVSRVLEEAKKALEDLQARNLELQKHTSELEGRLRKEPALEGQLLPSVEVVTTDTRTDEEETAAAPKRKGADEEPEAGLFVGGNWVKLNAGQHSFIRVDYRTKGWEAIEAVLNADATAMSPVDRAGLLDDAFSFVYAGMQGVALPLRLSRYLVNETRPEPWMTGLAHLRQLSSVAYEEPWVEELSAFVLAILEPAVFSNQLIPNARTAATWAPTPITSLLLEAAVEFKSVSVTAELAALFPGGLPALAGGSVTRAVIKDFFRSTHPDVRGAVLQALTATGAPGTFDAVLAILHAAQLPADRLAAVKALALSKSHHERIRLLNMAVEARELTFAEGLVVFEFMSRNHEGRSTTWRKLKDNWNLLHSRYSHGPRDLDRLVRVVVSSFTSHALHHDISEFFKGHTHAGAAGAIASALDVVEQNANWLVAHSSEAEKFLQEAQISAADDDSKGDDSADSADDTTNQGLEMEAEGEGDLLQLPLKLSSPLFS